METDNYIWFFSTKVKNEDREKRDKLRASNQKIPTQLRLDITEHRGTCIAIYKGYTDAIEEVNPLGDRMIHMKLRSQNNLHFVAAYAPISTEDILVKEAFYESLTNTCNKIPKHEMLIIGGDMNAKLISLTEEEQTIFGRHYLEAPEGILETTCTQTLDNRRLFMDWIRDEKMFICNTHFRKRPQKLITHKPIGTIRSESSWDYLHFDQIDYLLIRQRWKNANRNAESDVDSLLDADHYPLWMEIQIKFRKMTMRDKTKTSTNFEPDEDTRVKLNKVFTDTINAAEAANHIEAIDEALENAIGTLGKKKGEIRKPWISSNMYDLIIQKHKMEQNKDPGLKNKIKEVRRIKRKDWIVHTENMVNNDMDIRDKWLGIKTIKKDFKPNLYEISDRMGNKVKLKDKAEAIADYLGNVQWKKADNIKSEDDPLFYTPPKCPKTNRPIKRNTRNNVFRCEAFTLQELSDFLKRSKKRKACGPDDIPMEIFMLLDDENLITILGFCNECWLNGSFPEEKLKAFVASIFKKGNPQNPANYRPISLLCSIHKIYAGLIQKRLAEAIDEDIDKCQYGFRKGRSTATAVACIRRIIDRAEASKTPLSVTFLDWEKAFDRIEQDKLIEALERMDIPEQFLKAIKSLYQNPQFSVKGKGNNSQWKTQKSGIRQGCPLSPYLFIIVMTVIFRDVHDGLNLTRGMVEGLSFTDLLYADDTALIINNVNAMNRLLAQIEKCAGYHGLNFNKGKCVSLNFHCKDKTIYADGTKVPCEDNVVYLGATLTRKGCCKKELNAKISTCMVILQKMQLFWKNQNCPTKFKLQVYDAVIRSKLMYGLESLEITEGLLNRLNDDSTASN